MYSSFLLTKSKIYRKNSDTIVKINSFEVRTDKTNKIAEKSHERPKRSTPGKFTHWKYLHYHNRALERAENFVLVYFNCTVMHFEISKL